jgi:molybdate transport system ATP-binding protein
MSLEATVVTRVGDLSLDAHIAAEPGRPLALVGPNGAGKTTMIRCLAGLCSIQSGSIVLDGRALDDVPARARPIGVVFQDRALFPHLSARDNVAFGLRARGIRATDANRRAHEALDRFGIAARAHAKPSELSGGEAQRVAIARAIVHEPRVLLLDEPLTGLDVRARAEIRSLLRALLDGFGGITVLVSHDPVDALTIAADMVVLEAGRITNRGTPNDIRAAPRTPYAADLVGINMILGNIDGDVLRSEGAAIAVAPPAGVTRADGVIALLRPSDISLYVEQPSEGSARNVLRGTVRSITTDGERARVALATSPALVAEITSASVARLGLAPDVIVWATFKAVEVRLVLPG